MRKRLRYFDGILQESSSTNADSSRSFLSRRVACITGRRENFIFLSNLFFWKLSSTFWPFARNIHGKLPREKIAEENQCLLIFLRNSIQSIFTFKCSIDQNCVSIHQNSMRKGYIHISLRLLSISH